MTSGFAYEHNGHRVPREAFYAIACDPRRSVAVEACAGAGKTWMLVSRIVRALLAGCAPHEILAITFTKKAAGEMRERLHEWLAAFAATPDDAALARELAARGVPAAEITHELCERLRGLEPAVFAAGRTVQIRTFHSWFAALLRAAPLAVLQRLELPAGYELLQDDAEAVARVWRPFQTAVVADAGLRADYDAAVATHGRRQAHKALESALARRTEFALADADGVVDASVPGWQAVWPDMAAAGDEPADWLLAQRDTLFAASRALGAASAKTFAQKGGELEQAVTAGDSLGIVDALFTGTGGPRKFSDKLAGIESVRAAQDVVQRFRDAQAQHAAWQHHQRTARLARALIAAYIQVKHDHRWVDMNDVERAAGVMLSDEVLAGWVQQKLDAQIRHLLVDEFQDTNPLQWQALAAWLAGYAGAGGGRAAPGVFLVGDPKQSIYRFRRAEPQVFRAAQRFVVEQLGGDRLACDHTRRNAPAVIALVNAAMGAAQQAGEYEGFRDHTTESTAQGAVLRLPPIARVAQGDEVGEDAPADAWRDSLATPRVLPEETLRHRECAQAAAWIVAEMAARNLPAREVMVLSRRRVTLSVMQDALRAHGIATQQPEKTDLSDAPEVQDVVALLDALVSTGHDLSLARALRSPLFGLTDDDLVQIALARRRLKESDTPGDTTWFGLLTAGMERIPPHLHYIGPTLLRWRGWLSTQPPHDAVDAIYDDGDVLARYAAAAPAALRETMLARLRAVPAAALELDGGRYATAYRFVRALKAGGLKAPARADADAVRLLTVHGAKGLEASLVLMLDTDPAPATTETMGVLVDWPGEAAAPVSFVFFASEGSPPPSAAEAMATERVARGREELNGLYVATTRARNVLALSSAVPHRANDGSWWRRLADLAAPVEIAEPVADTVYALPEGDAAPAMVALPVVPVLPPELLVQPPAEDLLAPEPVAEAGTASAHIGLAMHRLLEWAERVDGQGEPDPQAHHPSPARLRAAAREFGLDSTQADQAARLAVTILDGDGGWAWNPALLDWQASEVPLAHAGQQLRIDRLVRRRDSGEWWVLDYKSAAAPERKPELIAQLQAYRAAVRAAWPGDVVQAAFLTGHGKLVVLDDAAPAAATEPPPSPPPAARQADLFSDF